MDADLSICIVNHQTLDMVEQCLKSIETARGHLRLEVLVVNNTLEGGDALRQLLAGFPQHALIQNDRPLGFAANQNQLLRCAGGRYWMPLNSDTEIVSGALAELVRFMDEHAECGIAGPRLVHPDGILQPSARDFPTPLTHFLEASGLWHYVPRTKWVVEHYALLSPHDQVRNVDWLTGACLIVRREAAQQVGLYDETNFAAMYGEDIDWCWRMERAGWKTCFVPQATVVHAESASPMNERSVRMFEGFYTFCRLHYPRRKQMAMRMATVFALTPRWLFTWDGNRRRRFAQLMGLPVRRKTI